MAYSREKSNRVYRALLEKGLEEGLCREIAYKYMNTEYTATRMLGYLYRTTELTETMIVDEMIAILEDRHRFQKKHEAEHANEAITRFYKIKRIEEADYGCEERPEGYVPKVTVYLEDVAGAQKIIKMEDALLYKRNLDEGDEAVLAQDGTLYAPEQMDE